jgi:hypothetical protein
MAPQRPDFPRTSAEALSLRSDQTLLYVSTHANMVHANQADGFIHDGEFLDYLSVCWLGISAQLLEFQL